jgi:RiboL-PSP-HEPN
MARYTSPYRQFLTRLDEVELLRNYAAKMERTNAVGLASEINAFCRGSIVLLSSHVEAYVKEVGETALDAFFRRAVDRKCFSSQTFYHISKDVIDEIKDTSDPIKLADKIFGFIDTDVTYWSKAGPFISPIPPERFNKGFANPKFEKVKAYFNRFGYSDYRLDFYRQLRADAQPTENMLDHLVDIRNSIAHGDPSATKTPTDLKEMISIIRRFCRVTDDIFSSWCKKQFCTIR